MFIMKPNGRILHLERRNYNVQIFQNLNYLNGNLKMFLVRVILFYTC